jgi:aspartate kinase
MDGDDLRDLPLSMRKANLARLLARRLDGIFLSDFEQGEIGPDLFRKASEFGTRTMMTSDSELLDTLLRTLEKSKDLRQQREALSSVSLTCFGGVSSDLPFKAIQILQHHGIIADKYVNLIVPAENREAAVRALYSLI